MIELQDVFAWLLSYFSSCPDTIKPCIFYLSVFPLSYTLRRRRLVRRWIAEGYSRDNEKCTAEEDGEESFLKLINLSMVQVQGLQQFPDDMPTMPLCQLNGFFLEYLNSRPMEDNLVFTLKGHCRKNLQRKGQRHLAIDESWDRDLSVFRSIDFSRLRSLTVFGEWKSFLISNKMRLLRVLDLEDASSGVTNDDVEKMVKVLHRLKFLSLRKCKRITCLPESLGDLKQLQTLDIRDTLVVELPKSTVKMEKLEYIRAGHGHGATPLAHDEDCSTVSPASTAERTSPPAVSPASTVERTLPPAHDDDCSTASQVSRAERTSLPVHDDDCSTASPESIAERASSSADGNSMGVRPPLLSLPPAALASPPPTEQEQEPERAMSEVAAAVPPPAVLEPATTPAPSKAPPAESISLLARCSCATLVPNLLSKLSTAHRRVDKGCHQSGVKVPRGIGKLNNLHTLGVVNISAAGGKAIVEELRNLTQLHKLGVSGINKDNCKKFFSAISDLAHLQSLSLQVQIDEDNEAADLLDNIPWRPRNLRSLKLYGLGRRLPQWIENLWDIELTLQMTMLLQEGIHLLPRCLMSLRLVLSEFQADGLHFSGLNDEFDVRFLEISCSSRLETTITFDDSCYVSVLRIRCGPVSSLRISGLQNVNKLEQVWLSGPYDDALKQHLESEIANYPEQEGQRKPVLRLQEQGSLIPYLWTSS